MSELPEILDQWGINFVYSISNGCTCSCKCICGCTGGTSTADKVRITDNDRDAKQGSKEQLDPDDIWNWTD